MIYRKLALQALVGVMAVSLLAAKGCTVDGDASLGDDEKPDASAVGQCKPVKSIAKDDECKGP